MEVKAKMNTRNGLVLGTLLLFGAAGCADLDITNPNDPDADLALATPGDVESLIGGAYRQWWNTSSSFNSVGPMLSVASFQHSAFPANFGMVHYSAIPRPEITNDPAHQFYLHFANAWTWTYRAVSAVADGIRALDEDVSLGDDELRARAYGKYVQGLAHGTIALLFDQGYIYDETMGLDDVQMHPYQDVMDAALGYFDQAIALSEGQTFTTRESWMSRPVTADQLARMAHSMKARYRAAMARTPEERAQVNWSAVLSDVEAGVNETWEMNLDYTNWWSATVYYAHLFGWGQLNYHILGMADQAGNYQRWLSRPVDDRVPNPGDGDILIITPDTRFPQGSTIAEQQENPGSKWVVPPTPGGAWGQPGRGTWRWSYYRYDGFADWMANDGLFPEITRAEMDLLAAEAHYRLGDHGAAAGLVNRTRTAAGLNATDAAGTNTSCVPKLPNGDCGGLFEMLKWEKRVETRFQGLLAAPWYFDGRGWGDLHANTFLHFPVPSREAQLLGMTPYTFGGEGGEASAATGNYGF